MLVGMFVIVVISLVFAQLAKGRHWLPTLAIAGGTAGLIVADPKAMPYFRSHSRSSYFPVFGSPTATVELVRNTGNPSSEKA
jgi:hypothetical protein